MMQQSGRREPDGEPVCAPVAWAGGRRRALGGALAALLMAGAVPGAGAAQERAWEDEVKDVPEDIWEVWTSPFRADADDALLLLGYGAAFGGLYAVDGAVQGWVRENHDAFYLRWLDLVGHESPGNLVGRTHFISGLGTVAWLVGVAAGNDDLRDAGLGCVTSNIATTLSRTTITRLFNRARPETGEGPHAWDIPGGNGWEWRSFPGGHASNGMSCASFLAHRFEWGAAEPVIYGLAASMGLARIRDEAHWTSDTFAGMSYGWNVGRMVAGRFLDREERRAASGLRALPAVVVGGRVRF